MSVRPIDFNGMIQHSTETTNIKTQEDNKPVIMQENIQVQENKQEEQRANSVQTKNDAGGESFSLNDDGGGRGAYSSSDNKKKKGTKKRFESDGEVRIKNKTGGFDMTI